MAVAALSTAGFSQYIAASSNVSASQQAFQSLEQNLALGNLTGAQAAFNTYKQLNQTASAAGGSTSSAGSASATGSQLSTDMATLGSALNSGSLSTAQSAFAALENDLKSSPSQAVTNAEAAVSQTVGWIDDLLSLSSGSSQPTTTVDPTTSMLDAAYGINTSSTSTNPATSLLESVYGGGAASGASAGTSTTGQSAASAGNMGSAATVNGYA